MARANKKTSRNYSSKAFARSVERVVRDHRPLLREPSKD